MVLDRNRPPYVLSKPVNVHRVRKLSDQLSGLTNDDLRLLRRFLHDPREPGIQQILAKPLLAEYTIRELQVALAILSGAGAGPTPDILPDPGTVQISDLIRHSQPPPPPPISYIRDQNRLLPMRLPPEIVKALSKLTEDEFQWLAQHIGKPTDPRSRFIIIRYHLYRHRTEDIAATIAALTRLQRKRRTSHKKPPRSRMSLSSPRFHT
ncbi:MAG: hypothetical protein ACFFDJ_01075 [Candidatus Odinarchaeota archaeon]